MICSKGPLGADHLNSLILQQFVMKAKTSIVCPILITTNDAARGLMNGDVWILIASPSSIQKGLYQMKDIAYFKGKDSPNAVQEIPAPILPPFSFGYCLSIHKSQGSEYKRVLLALPFGSEVFGKEGLYTGITRAKSQIELLTEEKTLKALLSKSSRKK